MEQRIVQGVRNTVVQDIEQRVAPDLEQRIVQGVQYTIVQDLEQRVVPDLEQRIVQSVGQDLEQRVIPDMEQRIVQGVQHTFAQDLEQRVVPDLEHRIVQGVQHTIVQDLDERIERILDTKLEPIRADLGEIKHRVNSTEQHVTQLVGKLVPNLMKQVSRLVEDVETVKSDLSSSSKRLELHRNKIARIEETLQLRDADKN
jgi:tetrahydromethanopterin S-methyltransferase subunit G